MGQMHVYFKEKVKEHSPETKKAIWLQMEEGWE